MSTVFEKLLSGEWPCAKVYEDEHVFAFMDAGVLAKWLGASSVRYDRFFRAGDSC